MSNVARVRQADSVTVRDKHGNEIILRGFNARKRAQDLGLQILKKKEQRGNPYRLPHEASRE